MLSLLAALAGGLLPACLLPSGGPLDTDASSTGDADSSTSTGSPTTTTGEPASTGSSTDSPTSVGPGPTCGDGKRDTPEACDDGEENGPTAACTPDCTVNVCGDGYPLAGVEDCDDGPANADDAACTSSCTAAYCGDGLVLAGGELCDDGTNDGSYGGCLADCSDRGPHCGDGVLDPEEACDAADASCIGCTVATSCLKIHEADPALQSGPRTIFPIGPDNPLSVYCDMTSDGGGYTFLKVDIDSELNDLPYPAKKAETTCAMFGMKLLVPRSPAHLAVAHAVAMGADILPVGGGQKPSGADYLQILGIYPKQSSKSCLGNALSALTCPQWAPSDGGTWYIADTVKNAAEPDPDGACLGCSMLYTWNPDATVKNYKTLPNPGGSSLRFMCDVGDKVP